MMTKKKRGRVCKKIFIIAAVAALALGAVSVLAVFYLARDLPTIEQISSRQVSQSTKIYDRTGKILLYEISNNQERTVVPLNDMPKNLREATVAVEDENFYVEPAFDWQAILRAFFVDLLHGQKLQGGSTITQQLAKNAFLTPQKTIVRKIKELILANRLAKYYSKDKILELYLNEIPYGPTTYGVEAASEAFFGKTVKDLNLAESALIAAIPRAPTYYSPWESHQKELFDRQRFILNKMLELGEITKKEHNAAVNFKLTFMPQGHIIKAPHFVMAVQDYLTQKYGDDMVRSDGLKVITTLDWNMQQVAEKAVKEGAEQNDRLYDGKNAALVAEDPQTGQILALVGSRDYFATSSLPEGCTAGVNCQFEPNFNAATQGLRQPGSSLKPFVYLTAFQEGYTPDTVVFDVPTEFTANDPNCPPVPDYSNNNKDCFHPQDFENYFLGPMSLRDALAQSVNIPAVKMLYLAGLNKSIRNAYNLGLTTLTSPDVYGLSLVLGGGAVRLIDLTEAYSVLAADGIKHQQSMILSVADANGNTLESYKNQSSRVADTKSVQLVNNILSDPEARSALFQNSMGLTVFPGHDVALKTGTSNDYHDAWSMGYTPSLVVGVWAGNNDNKPMKRNGFSILAAVPIWHDFMSQVIQDLPLETFIKPDPQYPQKPILAGNYLYDKQIHSILYYVDKNDPTGPAPQNAANDPQFANWEAGVLDWAVKNIPDFKDYNQPFQSGTNNATETANFDLPPQITIRQPQAGSFIGNQPLEVDADITASEPLVKTVVYFNGSAMQQFSFPASVLNYNLKFSFSPPSVNNQNVLEIDAADGGGQTSKSSVIIYK